MELTIHSRLRLAKSASDWQVEPEYYGTMYRYLVHGLEPGSFFTALLGGDWFETIARSHPLNTVTALKNLSGWISSSWPSFAWGSDYRVRLWLKTGHLHRRQLLEEVGLVYTDVDEVMLALREDHETLLRKYNGSMYREIL